VAGPSSAQSLPAVRARRHCNHCNSTDHFRRACPWARPFPDSIQWPPPENLTLPPKNASKKALALWEKEASQEFPRLDSDLKKSVRQSFNRSSTNKAKKNRGRFPAVALAAPVAASAATARPGALPRIFTGTKISAN
jgi:hypothetical protein